MSELEDGEPNSAGSHSSIRQVQAQEKTLPLVATAYTCQWSVARDIQGLLQVVCLAPTLRWKLSLSRTPLFRTDSFLPGCGGHSQGWH